MDRLCSECYKKIDDEQNVRLMKIDFSGDLCKECWDIEWEKCKERLPGYTGRVGVGIKSYRKRNLLFKVREREQ